MIANNTFKCVRRDMIVTFGYCEKCFEYGDYARFSDYYGPDIHNREECRRMFLKKINDTCP